MLLHRLREPADAMGDVSGDQRGCHALVQLMRKLLQFLCEQVEVVLTDLMQALPHPLRDAHGDRALQGIARLGREDTAVEPLLVPRRGGYG
ncbi:hypothetical protein D3C71_1976170 [compost metagenome]